ncbi:MAG: hypothetical protein ACI96M_002332, partial [Candidatus Azotimanducaceae bacterium]
KLACNWTVVRKENLIDWIQILTGLAVFLGLLLVVWEMQQEKDLVRAQLISEGHITDMSLSSMTLSENFASVRAKACFFPAELSDAELFEMYEYHAMLINNISRMQLLNEAGVFSERWQGWANGYLKTYLSTKSGQADLARLGVSAEIQQMIDDLIANDEIENCAARMESYFEKARSTTMSDEIVGNTE